MCVVQAEWWWPRLQERDRVSSASEANTRLRLKEQDLAVKKEALAAAVRVRRAKVLQLLGQGAPLSPSLTHAFAARCQSVI